MPVKKGRVALTAHVRRAGCASKIGQADLFAVLRNLPPVEDPNVLVGMAAGDDAGVYRIDDERALVQTVDVFTPCVDDPYLFGQIAAANSVSDVYAMGGKPLTALSVIGFPIEELDGSIMRLMLHGAMDKLREANCALVGGHSINDDDIKLGFAVTGIMPAGDAVRRDRAEPGDVLVLTKPIGTGMVSFGAQIGRVSRACLNEVGSWMAMLNRDAGELMVKHGAHACTDITGFGLAGHLVEMVRGSGVSAELDLSRLPVFGVVPECLESDILSGAIERNASYAMGWVHASHPEAKSLNVLYDPQTSGGLLVALPPAAARRFVAEMRSRGHRVACEIGRIVRKGARSDGKIVVLDSGLSNLVGSRRGILPPPAAR
jgi:selenide,water dikinase